MKNITKFKVLPPNFNFKNGPNNGPNTFQRLSYTENEGKDDQERSLYDTDRNIRDTILDSPFTGKEVVKGTTLLKSKKASVHDYISNEMMKASLLSSLYFSVILPRFYRLRYIQRSRPGG